jgi:hypothetical protein
MLKEVTVGLKEMDATTETAYKAAQRETAKKMADVRE